LHEFHTRDALQLIPCRAAEAGFPISAHRDAGNTELNAAQFLCGAQRLHPRVGAPWTFVPRRRTIDNQNVGDLGAHQAPGQTEAVEAAADNDDIVHVRIVEGLRQWHPGLVVVTEYFDLAPHLLFKQAEAIASVDEFIHRASFHHLRPVGNI
jgi:hypothetical protein